MKTKLLKLTQIIKPICAMLAVTLVCGTTAVLASSTNTINKIRTVKDNDAITDSYLKIVPKDEVETGSSIIISFTNARVPSQEIINGGGTGTGYKSGGYQYPHCSWDTDQYFYDVMPNLNTYELPYKIVKASSTEIEVFLINLPDKYAGWGLEDVNGISTEPCYKINLPIIADGEGTISCKIDSNGTSISGSSVQSASIYTKSSTSSTTDTSTTDDTTDSDTDTDSDSDETSDTETAESKSIHVSIQIGADNIYVNYKSADIDSPAYIQESSESTLVPLRVIAVALSGGDVSAADESDIIKWDEENKIATVIYNGKRIKFTAGSNIISINNEKSEMDNGVTAEISNGRMCVPFRALATALDAEVYWDAESKTASFQTK